MISTAELLRAGISDADLRALKDEGILMPMGRGIYARAGEALKLTAKPGGLRAMRATAAAVVCGHGAAISHRDAAIIHGLDLFKTDNRAEQASASMTRPPGTRGSRTVRPGIELHTAALPAHHRIAWRGVQVTSTARTVVDLARSTSFVEGVVIADSALRRMLTTRAELEEVIKFCVRWSGIGRARKVVAFSDGRSESVFESISRVAFAEGGLPPPVLQAVVGKDGVIIGRADFFWPEFSTIAEADGAAKYANPEQARKQLRRDAELREAGFEVVHFGWQELRLNPDQVIEAIRAAFVRSTARQAIEALAGANVLRAS